MSDLDGIPPEQLTDLERAAVVAASLAHGLAWQHNDAGNLKVAEAHQDKIEDLVRGQYELRQKAAAMRQGRHRGRGAPKTVDHAVAAQLESLADSKVSGTLAE